MKNRHTPVAVEGIPFILLALAVAVCVTLVVRHFFPGAAIFAAVPLGAICVFVAMFFRNPNRDIPHDPKEVVSPADGTVLDITRMKEDTLLNGDAVRVGVFMSIWNVHVNRIPMSGRAEEVVYYPGKFLVARLEKASTDNERNALVITNEEGVKIMVVQIAGIVARRIVCYVSRGDAVEKGRRFGLIRFGSRLDVYFPPDTVIRVTEGDKVRAGETVLGELP
ncbi:MAG: phosphatidylserine decarboxylase family protein [Deltaproteobacteria bacterium]|nr:phosphatidylserine decarboxylase family protein [Candidatus Zymogenaceae bacterium]